MSRLAIEIRYSVANLLRSEVDDDADSIELRFKSMTAIRHYRQKKLVSIVCCSIGAAVSMIVALWLTIVLFDIDNRSTYNFEQAIYALFCAPTSINFFFVKDSVPSAILISVVTFGLTTCYIVLSYNITTYYKGKLGNEMCRLRFLYAIFFLTYGMRTIY